MLGQDRYRRRYLALPHLGGILVEGPEELLGEFGSETFLNLPRPQLIIKQQHFVFVLQLQVTSLSLTFL